VGLALPILLAIPAALCLGGIAGATSQATPPQEEPVVKPTGKHVAVKQVKEPQVGKQVGKQVKKPVGKSPLAKPVEQGEHAGHDHGQEQQGLQGRYGGDVDPDAKLGIEFGTEKHDFGRTMQGEVLEHTFSMTSAGKNPLIVRQAKPTCGCTVGEMLVEGDDGKMVAYVFGDPIPPGRRIELAATLDTKNKRNKTQVRINVFTNDPVGLTQLGLSATVEPFMTATPSFVNFGDLSEDAVKSETIDVRTSKGVPILLTLNQSRPIPRPEGMEIDLVAVNPGADGKSSHWQVLVHLGPNLKEGPVGYALNLVSDADMVGAKPLPNGSVPKYSINANVSGRVLGILSCNPQYLSMGLVRPGQVVPRTVRLTSHDPNFQLDDVQVELVGYRQEEFPWKDNFSTIVRPIPGQNAVDIELRLNGLPDGSNGSFKGEMKILTGNSSKPEIKVTFSGVCRAGVGRPPVRRAGGEKGAGSSGKK